MSAQNKYARCTRSSINSFSKEKCITQIQSQRESRTHNSVSIAAAESEVALLYSHITVIKENFIKCTASTHLLSQYERNEVNRKRRVVEDVVLLRGPKIVKKCEA